MTIDEFKERVIEFFPNVTEKQIENGYKTALTLRQNFEENEDLLFHAARLSVAQKEDIYHWRNLLAQQGIECTPQEIELNCKLISIILDTL